MPRRSAVLMTLVALAVAGCGSTSKPTVSATTGTSAAAPTPSATTARFIVAADGICRTLRSEQQPLNARVQALTQETATARAQLQALLRQSIVFARAADAKLQALPRPPSDAATIERLLAGYRQEAAEVSSFADVLTKQEPEKQRFVLGSLERATASDRALAKSLGLKLCAASSE
jgi:hypothetical protein